MNEIQLWEPIEYTKVSTKIILCAWSYQTTCEGNSYIKLPSLTTELLLQSATLSPIYIYRAIQIIHIVLPSTMPVWSIPQWRAAVGVMAAMAASKSKNQKTCEKTQFQKQNIKFTHLTFSLIFLLLSHTFENHQSIEYCPNIQSQNLNHLTTVSKCTKRISSSSLIFFVLVLLVATQILSAVSPFLVEMLLMRSGDVEPNPGPTILTTNDLQAVCEAMYPVRADWDKIGAQLQIDNGTLKCLERENKECEDCLRLMLKEWLSQIEPVPCWEAIVGAVFNVGEEQLANSIRSEYCPQYTISVKANQSNQHNEETLLQHYAQELKDSYSDLQPPPIFQALAGDDDEGPSPSEKFINLVMTSREREQRGGVEEEHLRMATEGNVSRMTEYMSKKNLKVPVELRDIFTLDKKHHKVILIEGAPGSGKSTLFWHICQKWSAGELFSQFQLVLLVKLRDCEIQKAEKFEDILPFTDEKESIAHEIVHRKGEGVLLLFDGWDELPNELQRWSLFQILIEKPHKYSLQKVAIVVSSRQISSTGLQRYSSTRIEILGFTHQQIEMYVKTSLKSQPKAASSLLNRIQQDPVLQGNCYLPLSIAIITHTFICMGHSLPETFCRIIQELALSCLYRHIKKHTPYGHLYRTLNSFEDLQSDIQDQFRVLCEKAYKCLCHSQYSFSDSDMPTLGLMQSVQSFVVRGKSTQHYFLHLSLQELCAAKYFMTLTEEEQCSKVADVLQNDVSHLTNMLSFYSAFGGWIRKETKEVLSKIIKNVLKYTDSAMFITEYAFRSRELKEYNFLYQNESHTNDPVLKKLYYIYESQSPDLCQILPPNVRLKYFNHSFHDCHALRFILLHKRFIELGMVGLPNENNCYFLRMIASTLQGNMPSYFLGLNSRDIGDEGARIVAKIIDGAITTVLDVHFREITEYGFKELSSALPTTQIQILSVGHDKMGDDGLRYIVAYLTKTCLRVLDLSNCGITDEGIIELAEVLPLTHISHLLLEGNNIGLAGLKSLSRAIINVQFFYKLWISDNPKITTEGIKDFFSSMINHPNLCEVVVYEKHARQAKDHIESVNQERKKRGLNNIVVSTKYTYMYQ